MAFFTSDFIDFFIELAPNNNKNWFDEKLGYGEYVRPINSIGCYIPSGSAPLISTILMTVVPAKVAGVKKIIVSSPTKGSNLPNKFLLASAYLSGVDKFYTYGGPQAISSMAYGTENVDKVDMICGPGNIFVMSTKKLVYGDVGLDGIFAARLIKEWLKIFHNI